MLQFWGTPIMAIAVLLASEGKQEWGTCPMQQSKGSDLGSGTRHSHSRPLELLHASPVECEAAYFAGSGGSYNRRASTHVEPSSPLRAG